MIVPARLAARREMPEDHLEAGAELGADQTAVDRAGMRRWRVCRQFRDVLDQGIGGTGHRHLHEVRVGPTWADCTKPSHIGQLIAVLALPEEARFAEPVILLSDANCCHALPRGLRLPARRRSTRTR